MGLEGSEVTGSVEAGAAGAPSAALGVAAVLAALTESAWLPSSVHGSFHIISTAHTQRFFSTSAKNKYSARSDITGVVFQLF